MMLSGLPSDLIRNIVRNGQESFDSMRLISYRWSELCQEHLNDGKWLPVINSFSWEIVSTHCTKLKIQIPKKSREFFGINSSWWQYSENEFLTCYYYAAKAVSDPILTERLERLFNRCSSIKLIRYVMFNTEKFNTGKFFDLIRNSMRNVNVETLSLAYENNTAKETWLQLLDILRVNRVQNVHIATFDINGLMHSLNVLCEIARAGTAIQISAQYWQRDPVQFILHRASWEEFAKLMSSEEGITANLQQYATGKSQFSISVVAKT